MIKKRNFWMTASFSAVVVFFLFFIPADNVSEPVIREVVPGEDANKQVDQAVNGSEQANDAVHFQWQFLPSQKFYTNEHQRKVNGVALGYYLPQKEVNGLSMALIHAHNKRKSGLSMSFLEYSGISDGMAVFMAGGVQYNNGFALGLWNMTEKNHGLQMGVVNLAEKNLLVEYDMKPADNEEKFGVQVGFVNYSDAPGIQFGLWNTNPKSFIKHFPLFNICW